MNVSKLKRITKKRVIVIAAALVLVASGALMGLLATALQGDTEAAPRAFGVSPLLQDSVPTTQEELGRLLFYDARLSGDASISCATCHVPESAWTDGKALSRGYRSTEYFRNTPTLLNVSQMALLDWDGRFEQSDMATVVRDHLTEAHFMNIDGRLLIERMRQVPLYEEAFKDIFGSEVSFGKVLNALSAFVGTLTSENNPYVRFIGGEADALSTEARAGLELFEGKAGCSQCHSGELLSDSDFHALGVPENQDIFQNPARHITFRRFFRGFGVSEYVTMRDDPGLFALTLDDADRGKFRTPSLLEAARTAPYMHNGTFASLEDVVRFYNEGDGQSVNKDSLLRPLGLTEQEIASLVAFLESLGSQATPVEAPTLPEYELRQLGAN